MHDMGNMKTHRQAPSGGCERQEGKDEGEDEGEDHEAPAMET